MNATSLVAEPVTAKPVDLEPAVTKKAIVAPQVLNEAYRYAKPSSFSRGLRLDIKGITILMISGTASIDENGLTVHEGDFRAQTLRTYYNISNLLAAEGATWKDVVRTSCYLRDIERDYALFNEIRTQFFAEMGLDPLASIHRNPSDSVPPGSPSRNGSNGHLRLKSQVTVAQNCHPVDVRPCRYRALARHQMMDSTKSSRSPRSHPLQQGRELP